MNALLVREDFPDLFKQTMIEAAKVEPSLEKLRELLLRCSLAMTEPERMGDRQRRHRMGEIRRVDCAKSPYTMPNQITR